MTVAINDLTSATALSTADQVPISSASDRDTRKMSLSLLLSWLQSNLVPPGTLVQQFAIPTNLGGATVAVGNTWLVLNPAGTIANYTVTLPQNMTDGQVVLVNTTQTLTALTVNGAGGTVIGAPTTLAANGFFEMRYNALQSVWYRTG